MSRHPLTKVADNAGIRLYTAMCPICSYGITAECDPELAPSYKLYDTEGIHCYARTYQQAQADARGLLTRHTSTHVGDTP